MLGDKHVIRRRRLHTVIGFFRVARVSRRSARVDAFAVFIVCKTDGTVVAPAPCAVGGDDLRGSVCACDLKLRKELCFGSVLIAQSPRADRASVPAIGQLHGQSVVFLDQIRDVIGLILHAFVVIRMTGRKAEIAGFLSAYDEVIGYAEQELSKWEELKRGLLQQMFV